MGADGPHFLCIGASKAGTTWLHHQLMCHENIWVPFAKELHYFNHDNVNRWITKIGKNTAHGKRVRSILVKGIIRGELIWTYKYLFKKLKASEYKNLFPSNGAITGELTPGYAWMADEKIEILSRLVPDCKLIYILRNPSDRTWSQINMQRWKRALRKSSPEEMFSKLNPRHIKASKYLENLDKWLRYFDEKNIYIGFYDELKNDPVRFLNSIYSFLGIKDLPNTSDIKEEVRQVRNRGHYEGFPSSLKKELTKHFYQDLFQINERFKNEYTQRWLDEANEILSN